MSDFPFAKIAMSAKIFQDSFEKYKPYVIIALVSGGDDSVTALSVLRKIGQLDHVVHVDTTTGIQAVTDHVESICDQQNLSFIITRTPEETFEEIVLKHGFPGPGAHTTMYIRLKERALQVVERRFQLENSFCRIKPNDTPTKSGKKTIPLEYNANFPGSEALVCTKKGRIIMYISGARRDESTRRMGTVVNVNKKGNQVWVNILADWTKTDVRNYQISESLKRSPTSMIIGRSCECNDGCFGDRNELLELTAVFPSDKNVKMLNRLERDCSLIGHKYATYGHGYKGHIESEKSENMIMCSTCVNNRR